MMGSERRLLPQAAELEWQLLECHFETTWLTCSTLLGLLILTAHQVVRRKGILAIDFTYLKSCVYF